MIEPVDEEGSGYDYVPPGLKKISRPDEAFPNSVRRRCPHSPGDPHAWYHHQSSTYNGYFNRDESVLLYNTACKFKGKKGVEIGTAFGWSSWHILKAGMDLVMCDPGFAEATATNDVLESLKEFNGRYQICMIPSPPGVLQVAKYYFPWSFVLIDGNHDLPNPAIDAVTVHHAMEKDAVIMLHDCWSPGVMDALTVLQAFGWAVGVYRTSGLLGIAWRGSARPVKHKADPQVPYRNIPEELQLSY